MKVSMTLLVRNERDLIEANIRFHHALGVDKFIVMDNLSTDDTADIVRQLSHEFNIEYFFQAEDNYNQSLWVTQMARYAAQNEADWVINNDADEFWMPRNGNLKDFLTSIRPEVSALYVNRHNAVLIEDNQVPVSGKCTPETSVHFETQSMDNRGQPLYSKILHRASENIIVKQGNHDVIGLSGSFEAAGNKVKILHFPYCNFDKYKKKIQYGGAAYERNNIVPKDMGDHWRTQYSLLQSEGLHNFWKSISINSLNLERGLLNGQIFVEKTLTKFLKDPINPCKGKDFSNLLVNLTDKTTQYVDNFVKIQKSLIKHVPIQERFKHPMHYNLPFALQGPREHLSQIENLSLNFSTPQHIASAFPKLRDIFSLFPRNIHFRTFLSQLCYLINVSDAQKLRNDCKGKRVILVTSCKHKFDDCYDTRTSFNQLPKEDYHLITLLGETDIKTENQTDLSFSYDGQILRVPASDNYEHLHRKVFYAFMLFDLLTQPSILIKIDDDLMLNNVAIFKTCLDKIAQQNSACTGRILGSAYHKDQLHGWHIGKCSDKIIDQRGYQYPLPSKYPAGGFGYVMTSQGLSACSYMYLAMKEFFGQQTVGLEDAFVGLALKAAGVGLKSIGQLESLICLPGLMQRTHTKLNK